MQESDKIQKTVNQLKTHLLYPVIAGVFIVLFGAGWAYFGTIKSNTNAISKIQGTKVDREKFNQFVKMYAEFSVLTEERYIIINKRLDQLEGRQREIELERLQMIEQNITIIQEKMKNLLKEYSLYTREGSEVELPLSYFLTDC